MDSLEKNKTFSIFVERALPKFVKEDHPRFVEFTKKYFEFLEQDYNSLDLILHYLTYNDIDTIIDDVKKYYFETYTATLPQSFCDSFSFFIKHVREFYQMKGSENSFEYLFREFFDSELQFFYPSEKIFRVSDANWEEPYYIVPVNNAKEVVNSFRNHPIEGQTSLAEGVVTETRFIPDNQSPPEFQYSLSISNREGFFLEGETVKSLIDPDLTFTISNDGILIQESYMEEKQGILSGNFYLQDNYYYQDYSYELISTVKISDFKDLVKKTVHPAGFIFFSAFKPYLGSLLVDDNYTSLDTGLFTARSNYYFVNESKYEDNLLKVKKQIYSYENRIKFYDFKTIDSFENDVIYPYLSDNLIINPNYYNPHSNAALNYNLIRNFETGSIAQKESNSFGFKRKTYPNELYIDHYEKYTINDYENFETRRIIDDYKAPIKESNDLITEKTIYGDETYIDSFNYNTSNDLVLNSVFEKYYKVDDFEKLTIDTFENMNAKTMNYGHSSLVRIIT